MKKIVKLVLIISCFLPFMINVKAVCNDKDLNDFVEKLEINFFEPTKPEDYAEGYLDKIGPWGNTEYFYYFILSEDKYKDKGIEEILELEAYDGDGRKGIWKYQNAIGKWGVGGYNGVEAEVYTLKIKAVSGTCKGELLKETTYRVPKYNKFTATEYCEFHPEHRLCESFTEETENMTDAEFGELMAEYVETLEPKKLGFKELLLKYYSYILCAILPAVIVAIYYRRKIKRLIKMKNQIVDGDRRIKKKKRIGLFILLFVLFTSRISAASECEITIQSDRRIATVETVRLTADGVAVVITI